MSQSFNSNRELSISPSIMTVRDYYMSFIGIKDQELENGWGWFVDIETNSEPIRIIQNNYFKYKIPKRVPVLKTIKEYPSIRSMKSMKNLHDSSMMFDMDEDGYIHITNKKYHPLIIHSVGFIALAVCYYMTRH